MQSPRAITLDVPRVNPTVRALFSKAMSPTVTRPINRSPVKTYSALPTKVKRGLRPMAPVAFMDMDIGGLPVTVVRTSSPEPSRRTIVEAKPLSVGKPVIHKAKDVVNKTQLNLKEPENQSHKARDLKNCKSRPEGYHPKRAGGSASKAYVPWCKR